MKTKTKSILAALRSKFMAALPIILFFLFLFYSTILLFGISYSILVSVVTILFKVNYRKSFTVRQLMVLVGTQFLMALLSFFASLSLPLCILLNLIVPFLLVFLQTSQFNQLGYFANAMCFVFLQLRPVGWEGLALQMAALAYGLAVLTIVLFFCSLRNKKNDHFAPAKKGLLLLADALRAQIEPKAHATEQGKPSDSPASGQAEPIFPILQELYGEAYKSRGLTYVVSPRGKIQYMFALLFQRAVYFLTNPYQASMLSDPNRHDLLDCLARYMETAGTDGFEQEELVRTGSELLAEVEECDEIPCIFIQNFLRLFLLILDNIRQDGGKQSSHGWKLPSYRRPFKKLFGQIKADTFETRFALRLSAILTIGFAYSMISQANHGYWLVLNAFLLLRPMYEESATRIKTRFIGTLAGCLILQLLLPLFHGTGWHFLLATFMAVGLYMETAGTWQQALFSTCFALTLTTLALPQMLAAELRILYVVSAMVLVLLINRFVFPTHQKGQFRYNLYQLFHIHHVYLRLLESSLAAPLDYGVICDVQIHYHLIHDQIIQYLKKAGSEDSAFIKKLLWISWHMISEAEQMLFLINNRKTRTVNSAQMEDYLAFTACILSEIQEMLHMKADRNRTVTPEILYKRTMEGEPRLSMLMEQYSKQLSEMYRCVCGHNG
ncbi:MAG: FUSC family protein [Hungatella hathewayi]|uniref:FUSC family protein n=1 Tax=Hungatella TaxID=1649459 RepID=UPI001106518C|nr:MULTISPECIES: FUSC family protein [Hungatella]MCI6454286.1 FUSC family protein [Hungatella sp.]MCI7384875.1 FUSC family protein [Hungatella sp.]MDY6237026.1 FUSC family protein [Hungatella hathewayi]